MADLSVFDQQQPPAAVSLKAIVDLSARAVKLELEVAKLEEVASTLRKELNDIKFLQLPDAMAEAGLSNFALEDGSSIKVEDYVQGSLPKDPVQRSAAVVVLESSGGEALIKNQVVMDFDRKEHNKALAIARELSDRGLNVRVQQDVHSSTLQAFVREKLRLGEQLMWEKLGIFVGRRARIVPAESK